jgi:Uma2 family endonuclease
MNGINLRALSVIDDEEFYPSSDGQPMAETDVHVLLMMKLLAMLRHCFRKKRDVYVAANIFLYFRVGHPEARTSPDVMVVKGVDGRRLRRSFKTWVEKASPCFALELTSKKAAKEDQIKKKLLYQELGVREYFLFDPLNEYLPHQLLGYRLTRGKYEAMAPEDQGSLVSQELGLRLIPEKGDLVLADIRTGQRLLGPEEAYESLEEAHVKASQIETALDRERRKNAALAAELKRLRAKKR